LDETLIREIIDRLARIETALDPILANQTRLNNYDVAIAQLEASLKAAHRRLDETQAAVANSAKRIEDTFKTYAQISWMSITFFLGIIAWILQR
jgi:uncharacterized coiled-coil DUF342 family protein